MMNFPFVLIKREKLSLIQQNSEKKEVTISAATEFVKEIEQGNLQVEYAEEEQKDKNERNKLAASLISMRDQMKRISQQENERKWVTEGLARFVDTLRSNNNLSVLSENIIKNLVKYLNANQGMLFLLNDHNDLDLMACYAYERKKYMEQKIQFGEGLAGQAVLEKETIYLTDIPKNYIKITSGLGEALPTNVLIVPLKVNDKVFGAVELASFSKIYPYQIDFIEKLSESIAATISSVKVNEQTQKLLEETQIQTEQVRAQEEELRQNMEELAATQEEMMRNLDQLEKLKAELQLREEVFGLTTILSESDLFGTITAVNKKLCEVSKYSQEELIGKPHNIFRHPDMPGELFKLFWDKIKSGSIFKGIIKNLAKDGTHYWVDATVVPHKDKNGKITKYLSARYHITSDNIALDLYNKQAAKLGLPQLMN